MITLGLHLFRLKVQRCGVIPYTIFNDKIYFLFGRDSKFNELSDFGGGIKKRENTLSGGVREFQEESNSLFGDAFYKPNNFVSDLTITNLEMKMAMIFKPIGIEWIYSASRKFESANCSIKKKNCEICGVEWVCLDEMENRRVWKKISAFLDVSLTPSVIDMLEIQWKNRIY